jgi:hypothetical protein
MAMTAQDIESYLAELGQELQAAGVTQPIRILMVGGAYMLTQLGNRATTKDIDVLLEDIPDPSVSSLYLPFQQAVRAVAARHGLAANWINDVIGDALRNYGPTPTGTPWRVYGPLEVLVPERAYILALKLLAHRTQDEADIRILCQELGIGKRDEARRILDTYITDDTMKQLSDVNAALDTLFP